VPKSRVRKKRDYTPPPQAVPRSAAVSPRWLAPLFVSLMLIGLVWIVIYYVSSGRWPIEAITWWNLVVGFGFVFAGLMLATRWR
jgi:hypothetical protein